ncbi:MAG: phosphoglycerate dehydrogenase [Sphingomonadales bacterium]
MVKVLISDKMSPKAAEIFRERGVDVDEKPGMSKEELISVIGDYDGLAIRSSTKVTPDVLEAATNLKVIGRAGIGVDNINIPAASQGGVVVMNTPFGNSVTTAEHAIAMMMALARQIPEANISTQDGKWEKSRLMGVEVFHKTLGLIGCGNIGSIVATRAQGLQMKVIAYDPFLTEDRAVDLGVEKVDLETLFKRADFLSLHTPLTDSTRGIVGAEAIATMKPTARLINCARGGLVDEDALYAALKENRIAGAALDVFAEEPAKASPLFGLDNFIATPHLGASTTEAQVNVAIQVAEQLSDYLLNGAVTNALNMPSLSAEEAPRVKPYLELAEQLGSFAGQITENAIQKVIIEYDGQVRDVNSSPITAALLTGLMRPLMDSVNMINAPLLAKERDIEVSEVKHERDSNYQTLITLTVETLKGKRSVAGTLSARSQPRLVDINGVEIEAELGPNVLYIINADKPGFIGSLGTLIGAHDMNIATFSLGRKTPGEDALAVVTVDSGIKKALLDEIADLEHVLKVKALTF